MFHYEEDKFDVKIVEDDGNLNEILASFDPDCIISVGDEDYNNSLKVLYSQNYDIRKRWIYLPNLDNIGDYALNAASHFILNSVNKSNAPLVSICTPTYNIGTKLMRTYDSLCAQTYTDWEWVIVDDSTKPETVELVKKIVAKDHRVKLYNLEEKSNGCIGEVKYRANMLASGEYLIELDHDDVLLPNAVEEVVNAFKKHPEAGFVYSNCAEITEDYTSLTYGDLWAFGYGKYTEEHFNGIKFLSAISPNINPKTIRHIVSCPNHLRGWRKKDYVAIGGHNRRLTIADDYELMVRFFLHTRFVKIDKMLYLQFYHESNSQDQNRGEIQRRVRNIYEFYNEHIKGRFEQLGVKDWAYDENPTYPLATESKFNEEERFVNFIYDNNAGIY